MHKYPSSINLGGGYFLLFLMEYRNKKQNFSYKIVSFRVEYLRLSSEDRYFL